ncbi:unnamed protein product (plasmid) [Mycetohabitans rhizoxinica HKI 454]|uniref:Uncharacterized protein n=1 Tax=Mycetohabitans rhizoxinica (strain DSM 19002 / CIP 109453 / HKI 454) TaxID=882378 RepID=E5AU25_MYCRK|nr:unnamed protein product [Mycetohabitans rhizoxinica HKI 454]
MQHRVCLAAASLFINATLLGGAAVSRLCALRADLY